MNNKALSLRKQTQDFVVARASTSTWAVAFARHLIPGAIFTTKMAAFDYACRLAGAAGLGTSSVRILGDA